jgi:hypothetical protein
MSATGPVTAGTWARHRRIFDGPQPDGNPSWDPLPTLFIATRGTRARSLAIKRRSGFSCVAVILWPPGTRHLPWRPGRCSRRRDAARDPTPCAVRDHVGTARGGAEVDQASGAEVRGLDAAYPCALARTLQWVVASSQLLSLFLRFRLRSPADPSSIGMNMFGVSILRRGFGPRAGG